MRSRQAYFATATAQEAVCTAVELGPDRISQYARLGLICNAAGRENFAKISLRGLLDLNARDELPARL